MGVLNGKLRQQSSTHFVGKPNHSPFYRALQFYYQIFLLSIFVVAVVSLTAIRFEFTLAAAAAATYPPLTMDVRFNRQQTLLEGVIEVQPTVADPWGSICSYMFKSDPDQANVVCSQMGFGLSPLTSFLPLGSVTNASSKVWFDEVNCTRALADKVAQYPNGIVPPTVRMNISSCSYVMTPRNDTSPCLHRRDVGVRCVPPTSAWEFKLVNTSLLPTRGLVLMRPTKHLGTDVLPWGTVHNTYFRNNRFAVLALCRSMGFYNTTAPSVQINGESGYATTAPAGTRNGAPAYLTVTSCPSGASHIQNCTGYNFAALTWSNSYQLAVQCDDETDSGRTYGYNIMAQVKLINGFSSSHGQIYVRDSTYSSYGWNATTGWRYIPAAMLLDGPPYDSAVTAAQNKAALLMICRAAGFTTATNPAFRFVGARLAINGLSAVDYQRIECISNPKNVTADCKFYKTTATFTDNAAYPSGVDCFPDDTASRTFEYRLINGTTSSNGIVQMRLGPDTAWGTISNPRANDYSLWETVCGALGYKGGINSTFAYRYLYQFTNTTLYQSEANGNLYAPIYLDDVQCPQLPPYMYNASARARPNLNSIKDNCTYSPIGSSLYPTHRTLALDCDTASASSSSYRTNVSDSSKFRIYPYYYGNFAPYISSNSASDYNYLCGSDPNAYVAICRMLGFTFTNLSTLAIRYYTTPVQPTNNGNPLALGNLSCTNNATTWANCSHDHLLVESCPTGYPTIHCYAIPDMSQAEFRLVGGPIASSGRVEMRPTPLHEWGTIRNNGWMTADRRMTILLCRFLGYTDDTRPRSRAVTAYGQGVGMVYFYYAYCTNGNFPDCLLTYLGSASQSHTTDLGVDCEGPVVPDISLFEFRGVVAASTATYTYYRVEMREGPGYEWGRVYQSTYTPYLLYIACKAIGRFNFANNQSTLIGGYRNASLPLKVSNFACSTSSATALNECTFDENSYLNSDNSGYSNDFVVNCNPSPTTTREFRLANGTTPMNGRLEHRANSTAVWQSISEYVPNNNNNYWGYFYNVFAACRSLGFPYNYNLSLYGYAHTPVRFIPYNYFGNATVAAEQTGMGISCTAAFGAILPSCSYSIWPSNFDKMKVIALDCNSTLYSLAKSEYRINKNLTYSTFYYRFEMRPNPSVPWGTVASRYYTLDQAFMVKMCEAAGEPMPTKWVATTYSSSSVYDYTDLPIYAYRWSCPDGYTHIKQCSTGIEPHEGAAATTTFWRSPHTYDTHINCAAYPPGNGSQWTLRLVTGNGTVATNGEGILQIIPWTVISEFGTVCSNSWTLDTTRAACRSVGWGVETLFNATTVAAIQSTASPSLYGGGNVAAYKNITVWYSGVSVTATNYLVQDRAANYVGPVTTSSCLTHASDVALKCNTQLFNVADFEFRGVIVYPGTPSIVRLEMRPNPSQPWGTAYETNRTASNTNVAKAVCRMLGYSGEYATHHTSIVAGSGTVWLPPLTCADQATHPAQCTFNKTFFQYYTTHSYDVTVNCLTVPLTYPVDVSSFAFRLNNTGNKAEGTLGFGRLEVRPTPYAEWGSIDASGMTNELATAACRSAGFISPDPIDAQFTTNLSPLLVGYQWMYLSDCPDKPYSLGNCSSIGWYARTTGGHTNDVWLECYPMVNFRLYGGPSNASGLVQIRMGNFSSNWGLLCSDEFERSHEAWRVVCRTIGFPFSVRAHFSQRYAPSGSANTIFLDDLSCPPGSETIPQCTYRQLGTSDCNYLYDAASLECVVPTETIVIETRTETETHALTESRTRPMTSSKTNVATGTMTISYSLTPTTTVQPPQTRTATATPSPTASFSLAPTLTRTTTASPSLTATQTQNPTKSRSGIPTDSLSLTPTMSGSATASASASVAVSPTTTRRQTISSSPIATGTVSTSGGSLSHISSPTVSLQPTASVDPVSTQSGVASNSISGTPSPSQTHSVTTNRTRSESGSASASASVSPSHSASQSLSSSSSVSPSVSPPPSATLTGSIGGNSTTLTVQPTSTATASLSASVSSSASPSASISRSGSSTAPSSVSLSGSRTASAPLSASASLSGTMQRSASATVVRTPSVSRAASRSATATPSARPSRSTTVPDSATKSGLLSESVSESTSASASASKAKSPSVTRQRTVSGAATASLTTAGSTSLSGTFSSIVTGTQSFSESLAASPSMSGVLSATANVSVSTSLSPSANASASRTVAPALLDGRGYLARAMSEMGGNSTVLFIGDPFSLEVQLVTMALVGPCGAASEQSLGRASRYLLSPFITLGPVGYVGIIHLAATLAVAGAYVALLFGLRRSSLSPTDLDGSSGASSHRPLALPLCRELWDAVLFPSVPFAVALFLYPGALYALFSAMRGDSGSQSPLVDLVGAVCGGLQAAVVLAAALCPIVVRSTALGEFAKVPAVVEKERRGWLSAAVGPSGWWFSSAANGRPADGSVGLVLLRGFAGGPPRTAKGVTAAAFLPALLVAVACVGAALLPMEAFIDGSGDGEQYIGDTTDPVPSMTSCAYRQYAAGAALLVLALSVAALRPMLTLLANGLTAVSLAACAAVMIIGGVEAGSGYGAAAASGGALWTVRLVAMAFVFAATTTRTVHLIVAVVRIVRNGAPRRTASSAVKGGPNIGSDGEVEVDESGGSNANSSVSKRKRAPDAAARGDDDALVSFANQAKGCGGDSGALFVDFDESFGDEEERSSSSATASSAGCADEQQQEARARAGVAYLPRRGLEDDIVTTSEDDDETVLHDAAKALDVDDVASRVSGDAPINVGGAEQDMLPTVVTPAVGPHVVSPHLPPATIGDDITMWSCPSDDDGDGDAMMILAAAPVTSACSSSHSVAGDVDDCLAMPPPPPRSGARGASPSSSASSDGRSCAVLPLSHLPRAPRDYSYAIGGHDDALGDDDDEESDDSYSDPSSQGGRDDDEEVPRVVAPSGAELRRADGADVDTDREDTASVPSVVSDAVWDAFVAAGRPAIRVVGAHTALDDDASDGSDGIGGSDGSSDEDGDLREECINSEDDYF